MNNIYPKVSIVVPCYNHEKYIEECINSIVRQTYQNIELIVIDDGSTDRSPEILKKLSEKHGFYYEHQQNMGLPATLNKAIKMSSGEYISSVASDDIFEIDKIEVLMNAILRLDHTYAVVSGDAYFIDKNSNILERKKNGKIFNRFTRYNTDGIADFDLERDFGSYRTFITFNYIAGLSALIKKNALLEVGLYDQDISIEDWSMWLKLSRKYNFHYVDTPLAKYRVHETNSLKTMKIQLRIDLLKALRREKEYCANNGFADVWAMSFITQVLALRKHAPLLQIFREVRVLEIPMFLYVVARKIKHKIAHKLG